MKPRNQGFVLVCVLWVLAMLTVVAVGFGHRAQLDRRAAAYALDHAQAMMMARGAVQRGIQELRNMAFNAAINPDNAQGTHLGQPWAQPKDLVHEKGLFELGDEFEEDEVYYAVEDLSGRININSGRNDLLEHVEALDRTTIRKIHARLTRSEYEDEGPAPFQAIEELRYFDSVDDEDWFGTDQVPGLKDVLTVYGGSHININTAPPEVLACIPDFTSQDIDAILYYRAGGDGELGTADDRGFRDLGDFTQQIQPRPNARRGVLKYCTYTSAFFKITGVATRRGGAVRAVASAVVMSSGTDAVVLTWQEETLGS